MRLTAALLIALLAIICALPGEIAPWAAWLRGLLRSDWPVVTVVFSLALALAGRLLPDPTVRPARVDHTGLTVGLLLLMEPLLHLGVLLVCARVANPMGTEALLPMTWAPPMFNGGYLLRLAIYVALVPVCEEFFFRGRLLPWLHRQFGAVSAVTLSALLFAVAHGDLMQVAIALPVGLLLGIMRLGGADLGACMLAHAVHNGLFLIAGPGLVGLPIAAPLLAGAGVLLVVIAWFYHLRPRPGQFRHAIVACLAGATLIAATAPLYRHLSDRWWVAGVHRICRYWRATNEHLLVRLLAQERNRRLTDGRRAALIAALRAEPCQTTPRQTGLLVLLDPDQPLANESWENDAASLFDDLLHARPPQPGASEVARRLGRRFPTAFADAVFEFPEALRRWLPLPEREVEAAIQLQLTSELRDRKILLGALERQFPGAVAAVIHRLPPEAVTPLDQRHLRSHYPASDTP